MNAPTRRWPSVDIPPGVPPVVRSYLLWIEQWTQKVGTKEPPPELVVIQRLVTATKMRDVWRVLEKYDDGLIKDFISWVTFRPVPVGVMSLKERDEFAGTLSLMVAMCRFESDFHNDSDPDRAAAFALVADFFEGKADEMKREDLRRLVMNHTKDDEARAYVRMLGSETRRLFGDTLYGTVATVATIVLQKRITWQQVRSWCGESGKRALSATLEK